MKLTNAQVYTILAKATEHYARRTQVLSWLTYATAGVALALVGLLVYFMVARP